MSFILMFNIIYALSRCAYTFSTTKLSLMSEAFEVTLHPDGISIVICACATH